MTIDPAHLAHARKVADAVLYEGYLLYPYRQSAQKNQARFQFGVLMPPAYLETDPSERAVSQTECLAECGDDATAEILLRFLLLQRRLVQAAGPDGLREVERLLVAGTEFTTWDEATEHEERFSLPVRDVLGGEVRLPFRCPPAETREPIGDPARPAGWLVRRQAAAEGEIRVRAERVAGPYGALRLRVRVANRTPLAAPPPRRAEALPHALIAAHLLIGIPGGSFLSLTDPPEWAAAEAAACQNTGTWPVLAGGPDCRNLLLSSPVILPDHPEVAPESAGDLFDATEIDEILVLRTIALTDAEKQEARASDPRAAGLLDRLDGLPPEMMERMHGAIRYLRQAGADQRSQPAQPAQPGPVQAGPAQPADVPWWDPGADSSVSPETDHVMVGGVRVARGSRVRMLPGARRADAQDLFLAGREALVEAVFQDVDGQTHVAVCPERDPLADLQRGHGRFLYFAPDEIEPVVTCTPAGPDSGSGSARPEEES